MCKERWSCSQLSVAEGGTYIAVGAAGSLREVNRGGPAMRPVVEAPVPLDRGGSGRIGGLPEVFTAEPSLIIANIYPSPNSNSTRSAISQQLGSFRFSGWSQLQHHLPSGHCLTASLPPSVRKQFCGQASGHDLSVQE